MSDEPIFAAPQPRTAIQPQALAGLVEGFRTPFGEYLGASFTEGFWATLAGQAMANNRVQIAETQAPPEDLQSLDENGWRASPHFREAVPFRRGLTVAGARALAEIHDENEARRALIARRDAGALDMAAGFAAGIAGALPTPENFIPFAGPALAVARAGRVGSTLARLAAGADRALAGGLAARAAAGAATGALDATLGNILAMPLTVASREGFGDEVTWAEIVQDLAFGAAGGAVLGGGASALLGGAPAAPRAVARQDAALRGLATAASQVADGQDLNLALAPPEVRAELEAAKAEAARLRAMLQPQGGDGLADRVAARPMQASGAAAPGAVVRATTPAGTEVELRYEVVEADSLITSNNPDFTRNPAFPPELQPRERGREEAQAQVANIAARLRPEEVEASPLTTTGAPIVGPDGVVESGNGRTMAIRMAFAQDLPTAQAYRAFLVRLGFDDAATLRQPVLVRRRVTELDAEARRRFTAESNSDTVARMTAGEQARVDADRMGPEVIGLLKPGALDSATNGAFIRAFVQALPDSERGALSSGGELTPDGLARVQRALAARAYADAALVRRLAESRDGTAEAMGRALIDAAPALARLRLAIEAGEVRPELDAVGALVRAVQRIQAARDANRPLASVLDQMDMFSDVSPAERAWLALLLRHPLRQEIGGVGRDVLAARLEAYAEAARTAPNEPDMFGGPPPGLGEVLRATFRQAGLEPGPELRGLQADTYSPAPPDPDPPLPPPEAAGAGDPAAAAAARLGFDAEARAELAEAQRLAESGALPEELAAALRDAAELAGKVERADETWQAAAACAIRG